MALYTAGGRRRTLPPLVFGLGVLWHLLRHGRRYDVVHTASFPYFSLLAAGAVRPLGRFRPRRRLARGLEPELLARIPRAARRPRSATLVQLACARIPQRAFCFSRLHATRLRDEGLRGEVTVLEGEYAGALEPPVAEHGGAARRVRRAA